MLKIKLARFGKRKQPHYRLVVNEARDRRDKAIDVVGHYAPTLSPKVLVVDLKKYADWQQKGAQPTDTVRALVTRFQSGNPFPAKKPTLSKKAKAKAAAAEKAAQEPAKEEVKVEAPAETPVEAVAETPAAEEAPQA